MGEKEDDAVWTRERGKANDTTNGWRTVLSLHVLQHHADPFIADPSSPDRSRTVTSSGGRCAVSARPASRPSLRAARAP